MGVLKFSLTLPASSGSVQASRAPIDLYIEPKPRAEYSYRFNVYRASLI